MARRIKYALPIGPDNHAVRGRIIDSATPTIKRCMPGLGGAQPGVKALVTAGQEFQAAEFFFEGELVDYEAVELEASG
ncbi:hypothetical protein IAQ61_009426 [Plenodomus lingam]|uniref:uncharacterized protein n=1 Tax=Leptosphaeria maculans TaxID=5022 RepID=UPI00332B8A6F|nr:hypothetical protein IAQ61_009426 [Plenodomus lingam]